jgi:formate dehydrogenase iron-sulfur subunit
MFGDVEDLKELAEERVQELHDKGYSQAYVWGTPEVGGTGGIGGNHARFILMDEPETYNLPRHPYLPQEKVKGGTIASMVAGAVLGAVVALAFRD